MALGLDHVHSALSALREALIISGALALLVALLVTTLAVQLASRKARSLTDLAQKMASGDLHVRIRPVGHDEFADLGQALDRLAKNLSTTLGALREERDRLSGILENMHEGVLFLDQEGRVALLNPTLREMLVLTGDELGKTLLEAIRHVELRELLDSAEVDDPVEQEIAISGIRPSRLMVRATRLEGAQKGVLAVFVDVTETRRLENLRREFVANVSHELRTPVTSIRSAGESRQLALGQPEVAKKFVEIIDRNGERLQVLVEDLLDLSRIESKQYKLTLEALDLHLYLSQVLTLFSERASRAGVKLHTQFSDEVPQAQADRRALEHVVTNLVDNAIKYAGAGKTVTVSTHHWGDKVQIRVADNGPGIPEKHLPRIFERFYRIDAGRSRELVGTGLGLSIVKNLTESMGGLARVESREGVGSTFIISLQIGREPSSPL
jgi:two-component system phosphate regulon sensor histidine kinase PhoR